MAVTKASQTSTPALGRTFGCLGPGAEDIDPYFPLVDGARAAAEAVAASLQHEPGVLWWAPDRGTNLRGFLHRPFEAEEIQVQVEAEAVKDERVAAAPTLATADGAALTVAIELSLNTQASAVQLTLTVSDAGELLTNIGV